MVGEVVDDNPPTLIHGSVGHMLELECRTVLKFRCVGHLLFMALFEAGRGARQFPELLGDVVEDHYYRQVVANKNKIEAETRLWGFATNTAQIQEADRPILIWLGRGRRQSAIQESLIWQMNYRGCSFGTGRRI